MAEEGKKRYCDEVAEIVIQKMKDGTAPWVRPWAPGERPTRPANALTGREYRGLNSLWLTMRQPDDDPRWCTLKQANRLGGRVIKGSRSETIRYWTYTDRRPMRDDNGNQVLDADGKRRYQVVRLERPKVFHARVFHASQIEGLPELERPEPEPPGWDSHEEARRILAAAGATIEHDQSDRAFYRPSTDSIHLPDHSQFASASDYYSTALHELGHWTGHESRLDRDLVRCARGSEEYAREELRAEIASYMVGTEIGVGHDAGMTAAYVESWIKVLEKDPGEIYRAARDADKIAGYVMGLAREREKVAEQTTERTDLNVERSDNKEAKTRTGPDERMVGGKHQYRDKSGAWHDGWGPDDGAQGTSAVNEEGARVYPYGKAATDAAARQAARRERTYLKVEDRADNEDVKALGGKWDRKARSWYAPYGYDLLPFQQWLAGPEASQGRAAAQGSDDQAVWLKVPYAEKDEAKAQGARWNRSAGKWYAPPGADLGPLRRWIAAPEAERPAAEQQFGEFLRDAGLLVDGLPIMDGESHRVPVAGGKPGATDGMYVGHLDGGEPAGYAKNWKSGVEENWRGEARELSREEAAAAKLEAARNREERAAQRLKAQERTARDIRGYVDGPGDGTGAWSDAPPDHPYLASKMLGESGKSFGAFQDYDGHLALPLRDIEGNIWSAHTIGPTGFKSFAKGGRVAGCFHAIGDVDAGDDDDPILIASGFGTGAVIHEAAGLPVVCAMTDWNMKAVAEAFREKYPERDIVILGDDDRHLTEKGLPNSGREKAEAAAKAVGGSVVLPSFWGMEPSRERTDFADVAKVCADGLEGVRIQVAKRLTRSPREQAPAGGATVRGRHAWRRLTAGVRDARAKAARRKGERKSRAC